MGMSTYLLLDFRHLSPTASTLVRDFLRLSIGAQLLSNTGAVVLHVEEEGGQGALGSVGVRGSTLALLLLAHFGLGARAGGTRTKQARLIQRAGDAGDAADVQSSGGAAQDSIGMVEIGLGQLGDSRRQLH